MVLSLLCETEDKIFISHRSVSTLEGRFLRFSTMWRNKVSRGVLPQILSLHLSACVHMLMSSVPHAELEIRRQTETQKKKNRE